MRVGLDFRFLSLGSLVSRRGMGRYTLQQLRSVLAADTDDEFVLFCRKSVESNAILAELRQHPRVTIRHLPVLKRGADGDPPNGARRWLALEAELQDPVVFSWIEWPDKTTRDAAMKKLMEDPRLSPETNPMPFDGKRMIFGGFTPVVEL